MGTIGTEDPSGGSGDPSGDPSGGPGDPSGNPSGGSGDPSGATYERPTEALPDERRTLGDGRYELGGLLGTGGMGLVHRATDTVLQREVAIKLLAGNLAAEAEARERFVREGRAAARISDPHVVTVHDVGEEDGRPYLIMELVDGPSLASELERGGPMDAYIVAEAAAQALAGLAAAHAADVLHRDVKPGNLLRAPDGNVKVADFGVAEAADTPALTRTGFVIGTRSYLAPERRRGAPASVATDLYALGATLVELLTGDPPPTDPASDPRESVPDGLPPGLDRLLRRLLDPSPQARPASAETALLDLLDPRSGTAAAAAAAVDDDATVVDDDAPVGDGAPAGDDDATVGDDDPPVGDATRAYHELAVPAPGRVAAAGPAEALAGDAPAAAVWGVTTADFVANGWRIVLLIGLALFAIGILLRISAAVDDEPPPPADEEPAAAWSVRST